MATINSNGTAQADEAISSDGVCNMDFLNSQLSSVFQNRLNDDNAMQIQQEAFQSFLDIMPEHILPELTTMETKSYRVAALVASVAPAQGAAAAAAAEPAAEESKVEEPVPETAQPKVQAPQATFSQGGFQEVGSEPQFNSGGLSSGATESTPQACSTGFTSTDPAWSGGFSGDVPPPDNYGEADQNNNFPAPDPNAPDPNADGYTHGFQPPKWADFLLPVTTDLRSGLPQNYRVPIKIGNTTFQPMLDTGSSLLWVPAKVAPADKVPADLPHYKPATAKRGKVPPIQTITYGGGSVKYRPCVDTIAVADTVSTSYFPFGGAVNLDADHEAVYGILGLSPQIPRTWQNGQIVNKTFNLFWTLEYSGEIKAPVATFIGPNSYSSTLTKNDKQQNRGFLAVGRLRDDFYSGDMAWCSLLQNDKWIVALEEVCINGVALPARKRRALIDTGMSYLAAPSDDFDDVVKLLPKATLATGENFFYVSSDDLKTVTFKLGGKTLGLRPEDLYIGKASAGSDKVVGSIVRKPQQYGGEDTEYWVLGGIFLDNVVTSFYFGDGEYTKSIIGFSEIADIDYSKWTPPEEDPFMMDSGRHKFTIDGHEGQL